MITRGGRFMTIIGAALTVSVVRASTLEASEPGFDTSGMVGFDVLTSENGGMEAKDTVVIEYSGPIAFPMAENLQRIWSKIKEGTRFEKVVLRLNSPGGTDLHGLRVIGVLAEMRSDVLLTTLVGGNDLCASMCIPVFIQGQKRYASPASTWMFHGASEFMGNVPSLAKTERYFDLFKQRTIDQPFIDFLFENNYATTPGSYWISGDQLAQRSNIITNLLPNWIPAPPRPGLAPALARY